jgi:hypothetical protein
LRVGRMADSTCSSSGAETGDRWRVAHSMRENPGLIPTIQGNLRAGGIRSSLPQAYVSRKTVEDGPWLMAMLALGHTCRWWSPRVKASDASRDWCLSKPWMARSSRLRSGRPALRGRTAFGGVIHWGEICGRRGGQLRHDHPVQPRDVESRRQARFRGGPILSGWSRQRSRADWTFYLHRDAGLYHLQRPRRPRCCFSRCRDANERAPAVERFDWSFPDFRRGWSDHCQVHVGGHDHSDRHRRTSDHSRPARP